MKKIFTKIGITAAAVLPAIASAQSSVVQSVTQQATSFPQTNSNLTTLAQTFNKYVNIISPILASVAVAFFFYGLIRYIYDAGNSKGHERGRQMIIWGLTGMFVIFSLWGILQFLKLSVFG